MRVIEKRLETINFYLDCIEIISAGGVALLFIANQTEYHKAFQNVKVKVLQVAALALDSGVELSA